MAKTLAEQEELAKKYTARFVCMKLTSLGWDVVKVTHSEYVAVTWFDEQNIARIFKNDGTLFYAK